MAVCGVVPVAAVVPVSLPGAYHTGTMEGPLLHRVGIACLRIYTQHRGGIAYCLRMCLK